MLNEYSEFCNYIDLLYKHASGSNDSSENLPKFNTTPFKRMITILARRFVFPFKDKETGEFKNDFLYLTEKNKKKRLKFSISAIKYLYNGQYDGKMKTEEKFLKYLRNDLKDVLHGEELINLIKQKKYVKFDTEIDDINIYYNNRDAVIMGPLNIGVGVKYKIEDFEKICKDCLIIDNYNAPKERYKYTSSFELGISLLSYYYYISKKTNQDEIRMTTEELENWLGKSKCEKINDSKSKSGNYIYYSIGFAKLNYLVFENHTDFKFFNGNYVSLGERAPKLEDVKIIKLTSDEIENGSYLTEDEKYFVFVDNDFKNIKDIVKKRFVNKSFISVEELTQVIENELKSKTKSDLNSI